MADNCSTCGVKLSFSQKLLGKSICSNCNRASSQVRSAAEAQYNPVLLSIVGFRCTTC